MWCKGCFVELRSGYGERIAQSIANCSRRRDRTAFAHVPQPKPGLHGWHHHMAYLDIGNFRFARQKIIGEGRARGWPYSS